MRISSYRLGRFVPVLALIPLFGFAAQRASADQFYVATSPGGGGEGSPAAPGTPGRLYLIDPATGAPLQLIGPLVDAAGNAYGMTGLAFQPGTNVLYGATSNNSFTSPGHLVIVDRTTARVTDIGSFGPMSGNMSDITFDRTTGILYGLDANIDHWLWTINLATGAATQVGTGSRNDFGGGGLAANAAGVLFATPDGDMQTPPVTAPTLRTVDKTTGNETVVAPLTGGPLPHVIDAMDFDSSGVLFGIQTTDGGIHPTTTHLVRIDTGTAVVTDVGVTVPDTDALAILFSRFDAFQVRYFSNLNIGDSYVNLTNTGASAVAAGPSGFTGGNLCVNAYVFDQSEELLACCSCLVTPNGLASFSVKNQLISNNLTPEIPNSVVVKLLATAAGTATSATACNASTPTTGTFALGLQAWGTTLHAKPTTPVTYGLTETPFSVSTLSAGELNHLTSFCGFIQSNASGFGICKGCSVGGLGAATNQ